MPSEASSHRRARITAGTRQGWNLVPSDGPAPDAWITGGCTSVDPMQAPQQPHAGSECWPRIPHWVIDGDRWSRPAVPTASTIDAPKGPRWAHRRKGNECVQRRVAGNLHVKGSKGSGQGATSPRQRLQQFPASGKRRLVLLSKRIPLGQNGRSTSPKRRRRPAPTSRLDRIILPGSYGLR